jgi:t-SNARE complex subunit (syntaxin)
MGLSASSLTADQVNQADTERTKRAFVGFLSSALGVDQTYAYEDSNVGNLPGQYIIANPDGTYSQVGRAVSSQQASIAGITVTPALLILGAIAAFFLLKK